MPSEGGSADLFQPFMAALDALSPAVSLSNNGSINLASNSNSIVQFLAVVTVEKVVDRIVENNMVKVTITVERVVVVDRPVEKTVNPTQQRSHDWKRGSRIGEAKNPGPPKLVAKDPAFNKNVGRTPNQPYKQVGSSRWRQKRRKPWL